MVVMVVITDGDVLVNHLVSWYNMVNHSPLGCGPVYTYPKICRGLLRWFRSGVTGTTNISFASGSSKLPCADTWDNAEVSLGNIWAVSPRRETCLLFNQ